MDVLKVCTNCKIQKSLIDFGKDKRSKSGHRYNCKACNNNKTKEFRLKYSQLKTRETKEKKVCGCCKVEKNILEYPKNRYAKDGVYSECKECHRKYINDYSKARRRYDPEFKLLGNMRVRLYDALRGKSKSQTTRQLIGVNFKIFVKWIEYQLEEGMIMEGYGSAWHLDHVLPISSFNLLDEEELHKAMNWVNIRPLTPLKNIQKSNKIDRFLYVMQQVKAHYFIKHLE
jgi:transposase-like protein